MTFCTPWDSAEAKKLQMGCLSPLAKWAIFKRACGVSLVALVRWADCNFPGNHESNAESVLKADSPMIAGAGMNEQPFICFMNVNPAVQP